MRCLHYRRDGIPMSATVCPECEVYLPSLLRDVLPPGTRLRGDTYRIDYALGRGGFGITYRAIHAALEQLVAIKEFYPQEYAVREETTSKLIVPTAQREVYQRGLQRFAREGRILARLNHPNVVRVQDLFEERGTAYLVMELIGGRSLREEIDAQGGRLPEERVLVIVEQCVSALEAVHAADVYHLDIKPDNVLLSADGRVVLVDFGAARQGFSSGRSTQAFTVEYAAPEVLAGEEVGPESDLFELAMMAHEMLTGKRPPTALKRLLGDTWEPRDLPEPWRSLLMEALRLRKEERPRSVREWWQSKRRAAKSEVVKAGGDLAPPRPPTSRPVDSQRGIFMAPEISRHGLVMRWGRCSIRQVIPMDAERVLVISDLGAGLFDLSGEAPKEEWEALWKIDCQTDCGAVSPDGRWLALATANDILLWDLAEGREVRRMEGRGDWVQSVAFSPDGRLLALGDRHKTVRLWEVSSGREVRRMEGHISVVQSVAFSPDGQLLASGSADRTVRLWEVSSGREVQRMEGHERVVRSVVFSPDGRLLASGSDDKTVRLWKVSNGREVQRMEGHGDWVRSVAFSPDGRLLASGSDDNTVWLWEVSSGREVRRMEGHGDWVLSVAFSPDGRLLVSGSRDGTVRLWRVSS